MLRPIDFHCPDCGAEPGALCEGSKHPRVVPHDARHGNTWSVSFGDASGVAHQVHCIDRDSRDRLAHELVSAGMKNVTGQDLMVRRKNLMGGYFIEAIDTPLHLSPASETYHSM